ATSEQFNLCNGLVRERSRHHKRGVASSTTQVHQTALGQQNDALAIRENDVINLRLDLFPLQIFHRGHVNFIVEVTDIAHDGLIFHAFHVRAVDHVVVTSGSHEDVSLVSGFFHGHNAVAFHRGLQGADRVNFGNPNLGAQGGQCLSTTFTHVTEAANHGDLAGNHHVGSTLDTVYQGLAAAVQVVELGLGHRVVHVDG